jgi:hypothetical protein
MSDNQLESIARSIIGDVHNGQVVLQKNDAIAFAAAYLNRPKRIAELEAALQEIDNIAADNHGQVILAIGRITEAALKDDEGK